MIVCYKYLTNKKRGIACNGVNCIFKGVNRQNLKLNRQEKRLRNVLIGLLS
jgi:hypothetical protein